MNKRQFLNWLFEHFYQSEAQTEANISKYVSGLISNIDFYRMRIYIEEKCKSLPTVLEINNFAKNNEFLKNHRCWALRQIDYIKKTPKLDLSIQSSEYKERITAKLRSIGITPRLKGLTNE